VQRRYAGREPAPRAARGAPPEAHATLAAGPPPDRTAAAATTALRGAAPQPAPPGRDAPPAVTEPARRRRPLAAAPFPVDPECGMPVNPAEARHTLVVGEETLYFCCPHCKAAYERRQQEPVHGPEGRA